MLDYAYIRASTDKQTPELQLSDIASLKPLNELVIMVEQQSGNYAQ